MRLCLALALSLWAAAAPAEPRLIETAHVTFDSPHLDGMSGIELDATGQAGWIVADYGNIMRIRMERDPSGGFVALHLGTPTELQRPYMDIPLARRKDTEGIAVLPSGHIAVSIEGPARIWLYADPGLVPELLAPHFDLGILLVDIGLEALAVDPQGRLITIPEEKLRQEDWMFPVLRLESGVWRWVANLPKQGPFLPVGADFGPDGQLYLLERTASLLGFRSRVRRFDPTNPNPTPEVLMQSTVGQYDNLEGLTVWQGPDGSLRLTLVSDNNFLLIQRREIVEFRLVE